MHLLDTTGEGLFALAQRQGRFELVHIIGRVFDGLKPIASAEVIAGSVTDCLASFEQRFWLAQNGIIQGRRQLRLAVFVRKANVPVVERVFVFGPGIAAKAGVGNQGQGQSGFGTHQRSQRAGRAFTINHRQGRNSMSVSIGQRKVGLNVIPMKIARH